jgi:PAS domain S-box-containing protein
MRSLRQSLVAGEAGPELSPGDRSLFRSLALFVAVLEPLVWWLNSAVLGLPDLLAARLGLSALALLLALGTRGWAPVITHWYRLLLAFSILYLGYLQWFAWQVELDGGVAINYLLAITALCHLFKRRRDLMILLAIAQLQTLVCWVAYARVAESVGQGWLLAWVAMTLFLLVWNLFRIRHQRRLVFEQVLHQSLFEHSDQAYLLVDPLDSVILDLNPKARALLAIPAGPSATPLKLADVLGQGDQGHQHWSTEGLVRQGWQFEALLKTLDGRTFHALVAFDPLRLSRRSLILVRIQDIQHLKEHQHLLELQRRELADYGTSLEELQSFDRLQFRDEHEHYRVCLTTGCRRLGMDAALLVLWGTGESERRVLSRIALFGDGTLPGSPDPNLLDMLYAEQRQVAFSDLEQDRQLGSRVLPLVSGSLLSLPLYQAGAARGLVIFRNPRPRTQPFSPLDLSYACLLAQSLARSVEVQLAREQRKSTQDELDRFFALSPALFCILDREGRLQQVNPEWTRLLGYEAEALLGRPVAELLDPDQAAGVMQRYDQYMEYGGNLGVSVRFRAVDGSFRTVQWNAFFDREQGRVYASGVDDSQRRQIEGQLRASESLLMEFVLRLPAAVAMFDREMCYMMTSLRWLDDYRLNNRDWTGRSHLELFPDLAGELKPLLPRLLAGESVAGEETLLRHGDGSQDYLRWEMRPWHTEHGEVGGVLATSEIITASRQAREELRETRDELRGLLDALPDLYFKLDRDGVFLEYHTPEPDQLAVAPEVFMGRRVEEVLPPRLAEFARAGMAGVLEAGDTLSRGYEMELPDGTHHYEARFRRLAGEQVLVLIQDVTNRVRHEVELMASRDEARRALQAKSDFLAMMSHEIRTPLNGVIGVTNLLMETNLDTEQLDYLNTIQQSGETLVTVINDILDFSKIEAGKVELESRELDLRQLVEDGIELFAARAREKHLELLWAIDPDTPARLVGDPVRLRQVLLNLLGNAIKFTETGHVRVQLSSTPEGSAHLLRVEVQDTGIGISEEAAKRLFNPFTQADSSTTRKYGGTGLGLSICRKLVELMGGTIGVHSQDGQGSTFHFTVRLEGATDARPLRALYNPGLLGGKRILLLGEPELLLDSLAAELSHWGGQTSTGLLAETTPLVLPPADEWDLVLLLRHRGVPDGRQKLAFIQAFRQGQHPPVILMSGGDRSSLFEAEQFHLFHKVLVRPVRQQTLLTAVLSALGLERRVVPDRENLASGLDPHLGERLGLRVLLVEDNRVNQKLALRMLEKMGFAAELAENGLQAFETVQARPMDLVLMDMQMPVMDGLQATRLIRAEIAADLQPVIIAMTANAMEEDRNACLEAGMNDFITKPISIQVVQDKLRYWFEKDRAKA